MPRIVKLRSIAVSTSTFSPIETLLKKKPHHTKESLSEAELENSQVFFFLELDSVTANKRNKKIVPTGTIFIGEKVSQSDTAQCWSLLHPHAPFDKDRESMRAKS